jgi:hypothetical protein
LGESYISKPDRAIGFPKIQQLKRGERSMRRFLFCVIGTALVAGCMSAGLPAQAQTRDEQEIRVLEDQFAAAARAASR